MGNYIFNSLGEKMIVPAAMFIETARDQLVDPAYVETNRANLDDQIKELNSAMPNQPEAFHVGYQLGIQTARVLLSGMPAAVFNKVSI